MKQAYNCPLCSIKRLLWALKTFFFSCHRHLLKNSEYNMVKSPEENACGEHFPPSEKTLQKEVAEKCQKDMSLTSWCVAEGVTGGEGDGLLGAGAEWVGEIWDTEAERQTERERKKGGVGGGIIQSVWWHIPVHWNRHCSESHACILIKECRTA